MISSESAKEYYKYKKFLQTSEYYLRSEWEGSFQSFNRHKQISDILGIDISHSYVRIVQLVKKRSNGHCSKWQVKALMRLTKVLKKSKNPLFHY